MKALLVAIQPKWLKMILDGKKLFEFRNWKVPVGTVLYFYCTKPKPYLIKTQEYGISLVDIKIFLDKELLNGNVVAKAVVSGVYEQSDRVCFDSGCYKDDRNTMQTPLINIDDRMNPSIAKYEYVTEMEKIGYDYDNPSNYALELSQVEEIEPKDVTEFVSWKRYSQHWSAKLAHNDFARLTRPPQSRTWVYVK